MMKDINRSSENINSRYEIKMILDGLRLDEVRSWVYSHNDSFREAFPKRKVNNVYFDNYEGIFYRNHIDGLVITFTDITISKMLEIELKKVNDNVRKTK